MTVRYEQPGGYGLHMLIVHLGKFHLTIAYRWGLS